MKGACVIGFRDAWERGRNMQGSLDVNWGSTLQLILQGC